MQFFLNFFFYYISMFIVVLHSICYCIEYIRIKFPLTFNLIDRRNVLLFTIVILCIIICCFFIFIYILPCLQRYIDASVAITCKSIFCFSSNDFKCSFNTKWTSISRLRKILFLKWKKKKLNYIVWIFNMKVLIKISFVFAANHCTFIQWVRFIVFSRDREKTIRKSRRMR